MLEALAEGFALMATPSTLMWALIGVLIATTVVILPGISGIFATAAILPFALLAEPTHGIAMLIGATAATGTGNTITAVLFGMPGTPSGAVTILDGYPLAQKGEGSRAVAAGLTASAMGGIIGAFVLAGAIPLARPIILGLSSPEFATLIVVAIIFMAQLGRADPVRALAAGFLGLLLGLVGQEISTGIIRYGFGTLYLWQGIPLVPAMIGIFGIAEMLSLSATGGTIAKSGNQTTTWAGARRGVLDAFRHWRVVGQGSAIGTFIGMLPGLGQVAASFMAYGQAARTSKHPEMFGKGSIEGVIAPDASTNATDGGSLIPTLAFGIPGSPAMAIVLAAMMNMGIRPGPDMVGASAHITWLMIFVIIVANLMAVTLCLGLAPMLAKLTFVPVSWLFPGILVICLVGAYSNTTHLADIIVMAAFGLLGVVMKEYGYSRALLIIGLVLGPILERHMLLSHRIYGMQAFARPVVVLLIVLVVLIPVVMRLVRTLRERRRAVTDRTS